MQIEITKFNECVLLTPKSHNDARGYFMETYRESWMEDLGSYNGAFVQDNQSFSHYGTIRGLHLQIGKDAQSKLVQVVHGRILDVVVDLRVNSTTYGQHLAVELSSENNIQLWIPKGLAHGFSVLSESATVCYKCDAYYNKEAESGIHPLDQTLQIDWRIPNDKQRISPKDLELPSFNAYKS